MASVSWVNNADGNWSTGADWSTGSPPGSTDDVTISVSSAHTITHSGGNDVVASLYTNSLATLAVSGGTLNVRGNATLYGNVAQSGGTFVVGPGGYIGGTYAQAAGTLKIGSGVLRLDGTGNSFAGTLSGAGVNFEAGTDLLAAGLVLSVGHVQVSGATVTLGQNQALTGGFEMSGGTLALGGFTLTLSGAAALDGGATSGAGTVVTTGNTTLGAFYLTGSSVLSNTGTLTDSNSIYVGYYGPDTAQLQNAAGGTLNLLANSTVYGAANAALVNAGTLAKTGGGGLSNVNVTTTSTGAVSVSTGTLAFNGVNDSFAGSVSGGGAVAFNGGSDLLASGLSLTVGSVLLGGATVTLGGGLAYAGSWTQTSGNLSLGGFTLSESGNVALAGGLVLGAGSLSLTGSTELAGSSLSGSVSLVNKGSATQTATFYDGYYGTDTAKISNNAGATYTIAGNYAVYGSEGSTFVSSGTLLKAAGSGVAAINVSATSTGTITINQGTLRFSGATNTFGGTIGGVGRLELNAGADKFNATTLTVAHLLLDGAVVTLGADLAYARDYTQNAGTLALGGHTLNLTTANLEGGISNGAGTIAISKSANFSGGALEGSVLLKNAGTVTVSGTGYVGYYASDTAQLLNKVGATVSLIDNATLAGGGASTVTNNGMLVKGSGGGISAIQDSTTSTGTITVATGTLRLNGASNSLAGTINGAGTLELSAGTDTLAGGTTVSVGSLLLDGANLTLAGAIAVTGQFDQSAGTLALGGQTLTLSGPVTFEGGAVAGSGTITSSGAATAYSLALEGSTVFTNTGSLIDTNTLYCGYFASDTAQFINAGTGTVKLLSNSTVSGGGAGSFSNAGTLIKSGAGSSYVNAAFTSTGTLSLLQGTLRLAGSSNALGGSIGGSGTLELSGGSTAINALTLTAGTVLLDGAAVTLGANLSSGSIWAQTAATVALAGHTLTLGGVVNLDGGSATGSGKIATSGVTEVYQYSLQGSTALANTGSLTVAAGSSLSVGYNSSDTATLTNLAGGRIELLGNARLSVGGAGTFTNAGTLAADGTGIKYIYPATTNTGTIEVGQGTLSFQSTVGGAGGFKLDTGTQLTFAAAATGGATVTMGLDTTLGISTTAGFSDLIGGFGAGDLIDLNGFGYNSSTPPVLSFNSGADKLTISEGTTSYALSFTDPHSATDFIAINDHGVIGIVHA